MAAYQELSIDPELTAIKQPKTPARAVSGNKRKQRPSTGSNHVTPSTGPAARISRRSGAVQAVRLGSEEPSRGEEENLISYEYQRDSAKRSRIHSPVADPLQQSADGLSDAVSAQQAGTSTSASGSTATKSVVDGRSAAPHVQNKLITGPSYPYGLTPFRYPCLTPHHPPPPPGDPNNPNFHRFDLSSSTPAMQSKPLTAEQTAPRNTASSSTDDTPNYSDYMSVENNEAAFQSLSTLLAASQSTFITDTPHFGHLFPQSPGERSDGQTGLLPPNLAGRYSIASKANCSDCKNGTPGHGGHWVRSSGD